MSTNCNSQKKNPQFFIAKTVRLKNGKTSLLVVRKQRATTVDKSSEINGRQILFAKQSLPQKSSQKFVKQEVKEEEVLDFSAQSEMVNSLVIDSKNHVFLDDKPVF
jgi:hypothetical protein